MQFISTALLALSVLQFAIGSGSSTVYSRQAPNNLVTINDAGSYCLIVPLTPHTNIGDSEHPGGETTYCTGAARTSSSQGLIPDGFFTNAVVVNGIGRNGGRYKQITGCIRPQLIDRLNPGDAGGQYDSSGGIGGQGNPQGSVCIG
ncbi:hypothetical protein H0H92_009783 [Tricholoma furcatifolium]|nr:hypothetical protein H0H92_009783 [Tricholoma furcatifolium]